MHRKIRLGKEHLQVASRYRVTRVTPRERLYDLDNCTMIKFTVLRELIRIDDGMRSRFSP